MTTQEIISEHTKRVTAAVQSFERERVALILEQALADIASTRKPDGTDMVAREKYHREGAEIEQQRIIKLLKENDHYSIDWLIELIKGEQK